MTIVEDRRLITGGVDTHADMHVAAALSSLGGLLGVQEFPATPGGYASLLGWLRSFGTVAPVGIEGTGSYGAGLARHVAAAGVRVVEVDRAGRQDRHQQGKSDPLATLSARPGSPSPAGRPGHLGDGLLESLPVRGDRQAGDEHGPRRRPVAAMSQLGPSAPVG